jgi:transcriptional regulator with XRE-family HTH domain
MKFNIPTLPAIASVLKTYTIPQLREIAKQAGVSFTAIYDIRRGHTPNPGSETLRKFLPLISTQKAKK